MRCLWLSSLLFLMAGCTSVYKNLKPAQGDAGAITRFRPVFKTALYKADIDVTTHHLSGLLLIKTLPDSSIRMVFSNEMGFKFFDFEFKADGIFKVYYIITQMDKKPVIKTLRKDFALILFNTSYLKAGYIMSDDKKLYYIFPQIKGSFCYLTDLTGKHLTAMKIASPHKFIVNAIAENLINGIPDTIGITHQNFKFNIGLTRLAK